MTNYIKDFLICATLSALLGLCYGIGTNIHRYRIISTCKFVDTPQNVLHTCEYKIKSTKAIR